MPAKALIKNNCNKSSYDEKPKYGNTNNNYNKNSYNDERNNTNTNNNNNYNDQKDDKETESKLFGRKKFVPPKK